MTDLKLRIFPNTILRKKAKKVDKVGPDEKAVLSKMAELMYLSQGIGLAAVQVGIDKQLAVLDTGNGLIKMINPMIVKKEGRQVEAQEEGCLSLPGLSVNVKRAKLITVSFMNEEGGITLLHADGLLARAIQHEIDHLAGILIIDYLNPIKRVFAKRMFSAKG